MTRSFQLCSCSTNGCIGDLLQCAPCPPPMLSYQYFREFALNRSLLLTEVCSIARRCTMPNDTDLIVDCPIDSPIYQSETGWKLMILCFTIVTLVTLCVIVTVITYICFVHLKFQQRKIQIVKFFKRETGRTVYMFISEEGRLDNKSDEKGGSSSEAEDGDTEIIATVHSPLQETDIEKKHSLKLEAHQEEACIENVNVGVEEISISNEKRDGNNVKESEESREDGKHSKISNTEISVHEVADTNISKEMDNGTNVNQCKETPVESREEDKTPSQEMFNFEDQNTNISKEIENGTHAKHLEETVEERREEDDDSDNYLTPEEGSDTELPFMDFDND